MLAIKIPVLIITIIFALIGVYLAARIYIAGRKIDPATLRARAFLNESFLKESWKLILMSLILFIIRAVVELEELLESVMDDRSSELLDEIIVLGILICLILLLYKWLRLMNPRKIIMGSQVKLSNKSNVANPATKLGFRAVLSYLVQIRKI